MTETNVLHLITRFLRGGAETTTRNEIEALLEDSYQYNIHLGYGQEHDSDAVTAVEELGVQTVCFNHIRHYSLLHTLPAVCEVASYIRSENIDIVHTHSTEAGIIGRFAGLLTHVPILIHEVHGDPITPDRHPVLNMSIRLMERLAAAWTTQIIVKSERIQTTYLSRGVGRPSQYKLIYHGIKLDTYRDAQPADLPLSDAELRVLFLGRLQEGKGLSDLIEAFDCVHSAYDVDLLIAGDGPLENDLIQKVNMSKSHDSVHFLGYRNDIPNLLQAVDLLVLPSYREGTPRVISEALAAGVPVISTEISGIPEQVSHEESGLLIQPGDVSALIEALHRLLGADERRAKMAEHSNIHIERFSVCRSKQAIVDLYNNILDQHLS